MDKNGYPENHELEKIKNWPAEDFIGLMDYVEGLWWMSNWGFSKRKSKGSNNRLIVYKLSTGGWSGNEDIINALMENIMFWTICWVQSRSGGHHIFEVKIRQ